MAYEERTFHFADYIVFALFLLISLGIGIYHGCRGGKQKTKREYLMGNRQMSLVPVSLSLLVSLVSANTLLGVPAEMYAHGINYWLLPIGLTPALIVVAFVLVPLLHPLGIISVHAYLQMRFMSRIPRWLGSVLHLIKQLFYVGSVIYGPSTALEAVTGGRLPSWASIVVVTAVGTIYTTLGGMKGVIWTDVFQSVIMIAGMMAIVIQGSLEVGGINEVIQINVEDKRINFSKFFDVKERFNFWALLIGHFFFWSSEYGVNQPMAQRYCSLPTQTKAKLAVLLNIPGFILLQSLSALAGITAYAYYAKRNCDPLSDPSQHVTNPNQILPVFTLDVLGYPGIPGLMLACIFGGSLSSLSSSLNSLSACIWEDFLKQPFGRMSEDRSTLLVKILVCVFGVLCLAMAFMMSFVGGTMIQLSMSFAGVAIGGLLAMYALGGLLSFTNKWGATVGGVVSVAVLFWMLIGSILTGSQKPPLKSRTSGCLGINTTTTAEMLQTTAAAVLSTSVMPPPEPGDGLRRLYGVSFVWYPAIGFGICAVVGLLVSLITCFIGRFGLGKEKQLVSRNLYCCCVKPLIHTSGENDDQNNVVKPKSIEMVQNGGFSNAAMTVD